MTRSLIAISFWSDRIHPIAKANGLSSILTQNFIGCPLYEFLKQELPFTINIGWGIGNSIDEARTNALIANQLSDSREEQASFIITEGEQIIGPLGEGNCLTVSNSLNPEIEKVSEQTGVASLKIQKILAAMLKKNTNEFSADDLAAYLGISTRSSNRILNKFEEAGTAQVLYKKQQKLRGRPKKIYRIMLNIKKSASALLSHEGHWKTDEEAVAAAGGLK
ncbi:hypothetical protein [Pseudalkalibacillus decolorationis]|uniref:hypothetical protein n=1 Tax=Pseudalkalibacillus decolorationis TaxID=163879 RepID=UPI00214886AD|nr:hypothetical protein [Pseudalkalibacillus decolorationis]